MSGFSWAFDIASHKAAIPGWNNDILSMTHSLDIAHFVIRVLDVNVWPKFRIVVGFDLTLDEALFKLKNILGKTFDISYDSEEKLKGNDSTLLNGYEGVTKEQIKGPSYMFGRMVISGSLYMSKENRMSDMHPNIRPLTVDELLTKAWAGKA